jgi:tripartite-type tricarboxylate transporter receptor subunit TctC
MHQDHKRKHGATWRRAARAIGGMLALAAVTGAQAQQYPNRAITIIVPFTPGTGIDIMARTIGQKVSERWGASVVADNRAGASGNIGAEMVAKAPPDGYTLMMTATSLATNAAINRNLRYDPAKSFAPISLVATGTMAFITSTNTPAASVREFVALAKAEPAKLNYASSGNGTPQHLSMELFKLDTGIDVTHIPYKGAAGAVTDVVGGRVNSIIMPIHTAHPYVQGGKLKMLAVMAPERSPLYPNVPTLREAGYPNVQVDVWYGLLAPAGTPAEIVNRWNAEVNAILALPDVREILSKQGLNAAGGRAELLADMIRTELARWPRVVTAAGIKAD